MSSFYIVNDNQYTSNMNTNRWMVVCSYSIREMHQIMDKMERMERNCNMPIYGKRAFRAFKLTPGG